MRITYLLETAAQLWGGVKSVLEAANQLEKRGHQVCILSKSGPPEWMNLDCEFRQVDSFSKQQIPDSDVLIATFWTTLPPAIQSGRGIPVHYCQGYEAAGVEDPRLADQIRRVYALPGSEKITISSHLHDILAGFGHSVRQVTYAIDHRVMYPSRERAAYEPIRVGLVGPYEIPWKDIRTGIDACLLADQAGLEIELVRITNTRVHPEELQLPIPVDLHQQVPPAQMGELYRSLDVFLGSSRGIEEGFFLPAIEAMACGIPCVLTDIPCFRGYGEGAYATFVPPQDPMAMAKALIQVGMDPELRGNMRRAGIAVAAKYRMDRHIDEFEAALEGILSKAHSGLNSSEIPRDPRLAALHAQRALQLDSQGRPAEALKSLERAIELDPNEASKHNQLEELRRSLIRS